jgi:hypothetical protein
MSKVTGSAIIFARKGIPPFFAEAPSEICMLLNFLTLFLFYMIQIKNGNFCWFLFRFLKVSGCKIFVWINTLWSLKFSHIVAFFKQSTAVRRSITQYKNSKTPRIQIVISPLCFHVSRWMPTARWCADSLCRRLLVKRILCPWLASLSVSVVTCDVDMLHAGTCSK